MRAEVENCSSDIRSLMNELRPTVLDHLGLYEALSEYLIGQIETAPFVLTANLDPELRGWASRQDAMLFRLVQEALLNVRKHGRATRVEVSLCRVDGRVVLSIIDDGCGFAPSAVPNGRLGLQMMGERAEAAGGRLAVDSAPGRGTAVRVVF